MLKLTGNNLGARQKELNTKVNEVASSCLDFEQITDTIEESDVDKLFKIDVASKYKNIDYIVDTLKSGDSLFISRALKCSWIFDSQYMHIINVDYLHHNVFGFMSIKMKSKFLTTAAMYIKCPERAEEYYTYCMEMKLTNLALKFLILTSEEFKLDFLKEHSNLLINVEGKKFFQYFIGQSFTLADAYLSTLNFVSRKITYLYEIRYLYNISNEQYLNMLENCTKIIPNNNKTKLGLRISKDILTKHKNRVLSNPLIYIKFLNKTSIVKYSTLEDVKIYLLALCPIEENEFWSQNFCNLYKHIVNLLPADERYEFIETLFKSKYPGQIFETGVRFYNLEYFKMMTEEQKEKWALNQVDNEEEILGAGKNYNFYKFINFTKAFEDIKRLIMITSDHHKRAELVQVLLESAKTQRDLETLFKYYHARHNNEQRSIKERFVDMVANTHHVYKFDSNCWTAFNKILQNLDVYGMNTNCKIDFKLIALIYQIINNIEVHEAIKDHIKSQMVFYKLKQNTYKLTKEQEEMVYQYLFNFYMVKVNELDKLPYEDDVKYQVRRPVYFVLDLLTTYGKTKKDIPEVVMKFMLLDNDEFNRHKMLYVPPNYITEGDLIRYLKSDTKLLIDNLPVVKDTITPHYFQRLQVGIFLRKIKVYFPNDIAKEYFNFFDNLLNTHPMRKDVAQSVSYAIFVLADHQYIKDFMTKYAPKGSKLNLAECDTRFLHIQEAICSTAFYSRPPIPINYMLMYIKGDYAKYCVPLMNSCLVNLPLPVSMEFVERLLRSPVSIQKHGIRLAFGSFNEENLNKLVTRIWIKSKNTSIRYIIYNALYKKILKEKPSTQNVLFITLKSFTLDLHKDDDERIFSIMTSYCLPEHLVSEYAHVTWLSASSMPITKTSHLQTMTGVLKRMSYHSHLIRQDIMQRIVEDFKKDMFDTPESLRKQLSPGDKDLYRTKLEIISKYIINVQDRDDLQKKVKLCKSIINKSINMFNAVSEENKYIGREICFSFIRIMLSENTYTYRSRNAILEEIVLTLRKLPLKIHDTYMIIWEIQMDIAVRNAITEIHSKEDESEKSFAFREIIYKFGLAIGDLIKYHIDRNTYFKSLVPNIQSLLLREIENIADFIVDVEIPDILVITSLALIEFKTLEMYCFIVNIIPVDYNSHYVKDYESILQEIKSIDNKEITCLMFERFVNSDYTSRLHFLPGDF